MKVKIRPFWDWNLVTQDHIVKIEQLKSDHFGIEIMLKCTGLMNYIIVKIRPFWDWNTAAVSGATKAKKLKSDHFGIEIYLLHYLG